MGSSGIGACIIASHFLHEQAGRTWRITSKRPGTYSSTSVTASPTLRRSPPPQILQASGVACTTSRRGSAGGNVRRFFFDGAAGSAGTAPSVDAGVASGVGADSSAFCVGASAAALPASASSSASSSCSITRSMRSELAPNFSRFSFAICAFSFSIVSCTTMRPFLAASRSLIRSASSALAVITSCFSAAISSGS